MAGTEGRWPMAEARSSQTAVADAGQGADHPATRFRTE